SYSPSLSFLHTPRRSGGTLLCEEGPDGPAAARSPVSTVRCMSRTVTIATTTHSRFTRTRGAAAIGVALARMAQIMPIQAASAAPQEDVQGWLEEVVASGGPAIAVVGTHGNEVAVEAGAGQGDGGTVDERSSFRRESTSKSSAASGVMQLVGETRVDVDVPVTQYLPDLRLDDERAESITVRQLLNQSSRSSDATLGFDQYAAGPQTPREAGELLSRSRLAFDPGTDWAYSNPNYWICAQLIEKVSGQDLDTYLQQNILNPLGMDETTRSEERRVGKE